MSDEAGRPLPFETETDGPVARGVYAHAPGARRRVRLWGPLGLAAVAALAGFAADQAGKDWAFRTAPGHAGPRELVPGLLTGVLARNDGAMGNLAGGRPATAPLCALQGLAFLGA